MTSSNEVVYCKKCVISNPRPSSVVEFNKDSIKDKELIDFDKEGVCSACRYAEIKNDEIDWEKREKLKHNKIRGNTEYSI